MLGFRFFMPMHLPLPIPTRRWCSALLIAAAALLLAGCSMVSLAYNQAPHVLFWQLNRYLDLSETQVVRVRDELGDLHQWHRSTMLPAHAAWLQTVQQALPGRVTPEQVCSHYDQGRAQFEQVLNQAEPALVWLATQLSDAQLRTLRRRQADADADWRQEWVEPTPAALVEHRTKLLVSRLEGFYGSLDGAQKDLLRSVVAQSPFDPPRSFRERQRRNADLLQTLTDIAQDRSNLPRARTLMRGYLDRLGTSPDASYRRYAKVLTDGNCEAFAQLHNAMSPAQKAKAVQALQGYRQDFLTLASR